MVHKISKVRVSYKKRDGDYLILIFMYHQMYLSLLIASLKIIFCCTSHDL